MAMYEDPELENEEEGTSDGNTRTPPFTGLGGELIRTAGKEGTRELVRGIFDFLFGDDDNDD